jgi:WXG100 family type VII secretion target
MLAKEKTMADIIKMNYEQMEDMARSLGQASQDLESMVSAVGSIADMLEGGGLIGAAGDAFSDACRNPLTRALQTLQAKMSELQGDINGAMQDMQSADSETKGFYG